MKRSNTGGFSGRVFGRKGRDRTDIAREIAALVASKSWALTELHQEEGKLDEVFRAITRKDS